MHGGLFMYHLFQSVRARDGTYTEIIIFLILEVKFNERNCFFKYYANINGSQ